MARILIVDDEPNERQGLCELLRTWGYEVESAGDGIAALELLRYAQSPGQHPLEAVLTDIRMPRMDGLQLLGQIREQHGSLPVLVLTGQGSKEAVVECLRLRANDYIEKPIRREELKHRLADLLRRPAPVGVPGREPAQEALQYVGDSAAAQATRQLVQQVAPTTASVLITGESGTGKEVVARAIHRLSPRQERTFLAINCAAIPESLMESEIFGHERGAFTGAVDRRAGCFELAEGGTLLLDEIGEMPLQTQAKLLRVLEDRHLRRLGSKQEQPVNVRVLAATNRDPHLSIKQGQLREDLFYRLNVFHVHLPPLRERMEDLEPLCQALIRQLNGRHRRTVATLHPELLLRFRRYHWPGNVRELRNTLERGVILAEGNELEARHLPPDFGQAPAPADSGLSIRITVGTSVAEAERQLILLTLTHEKNNKTRTAERLGISLKTLQNKLKEYQAGELSAEAAGEA